MEFIQWCTQRLDQVTHEPIGEPTNCALFKLDEFDQELLEDEIKEFIDIETEKEIAEGNITHGNLSKYTRIIEEDLKTYKVECLHIFARLLGFRYIIDITLKHNDESYEEFSKRAKLEGLGNFIIMNNSSLGKKLEYYGE